jgi:ribosomal protein S18 acetylase RimI-like enzyme
MSHRPSPDGLPDVGIQFVTVANARLLDRVDDDVFDHPIQPALLDAFLASPANHLVVAVVEGEVIGMASGIAYVHPDKPLQLFVNEVGVSSRFHRRGIATRLVNALLGRGKEIGCQEAWVATEVDNGAARALYASLGFREDDDPAVVYVRSLVDDQGERAADEA